MDATISGKPTESIMPPLSSAATKSDGEKSDRSRHRARAAPLTLSSSIAIVGGGIAGAAAATRLAARFDRVTLFDQGRRGPGGRASHRSVSAGSGLVVLGSEEGEGSSSSSREPTHEFDHGCQFFRADSAAMRRLTAEWVEAGWAAPWEARLGSLRIGDGRAPGETNEDDDGAEDFFGVPSSSDPVYVSAGGMHNLPCRMLRDASNVDVRAGTRVARVSRSASGDRWEVFGTTGSEAYHDTATSSSPPSSSLLISADAVIFTDISTTFDSWHKASAGMPDEFRRRLVRSRSDDPIVRVPMFSCMVALDRPVASRLPHDAFVVAAAAKKKEGGSAAVRTHAPPPPALWFAACSQSKPGFYGDGGDGPAAAVEKEAECWTLVSTPEYAISQIKATPMRDPVTGEFVPQSDGYLNSVPGIDLFNSFLDAIGPYCSANKMEQEAPAAVVGVGKKDAEAIAEEVPTNLLPKAVYLQAQRWGSAIPVPKSLAVSVEDIAGTRYASSLRSSIVYNRRPRASTDGNAAADVDRGEDDGDADYVADDESGLYCAGDFCSRRNPGFEASALSGLDVADHIISLLEG